MAEVAMVMNCGQQMKMTNEQMEETDGFVTVVQVSNGDVNIDNDEDSNAGAFVTVVELDSSAQTSDDSDQHEINSQALSQRQEVVMYRLPCERLGMGLKFDGGMQATECVRHVYIQSVASDSPAFRTQTAWNGLVEGDEILRIDGRNVSEMTRVECVNTLKKAPVAIKLYVLHLCNPPSKLDSKERTNNKVNNQPGLKSGQYLEMSLPAKGSPPSPPPVPPRKSRIKKSSSPPTPPPRQMDLLLDHNMRSQSMKNSALSTVTELLKDEALKAKVSGEVEELNSERRNEYESDDTASSASTVIERLNVTNNIYFLVPDRKPTLDIDELLMPFEQLEKELELDVPSRTTEVANPLEPPEKFKDVYKYDPLDSSLNQVPFPKPQVQRSFSLRGTEFVRDNKEDEGPPPIPPRKSKLSKSNSYEPARRIKHINTPSDEWSEDDITLSIVGNLLQELEQLPEFSRSNPRTNPRTNAASDDIPRQKSKTSNESNHEQTDNCKASEPEVDACVELSVPAPQLFEDLVETEQQQAEATLLKHGEDQVKQSADNQQQEGAFNSTDQTSANVMANEVIFSPCSLRDFNDSQQFLPVYSRLPPDGHEFPSNYMEAKDDLFQFCTVGSTTKSKDEHFQLTAPVEATPALIQPPAGFEDNLQAAKLSFLNNGSQYISGDYSANVDEETHEDDDDYIDLPPPPLPPSPPQHQQLLYQIVNEPLEFDDYDDDEDMLSNGHDSPPPVPPKRLSSTTSSSSSSTEKTVIAVTSPTIAIPAPSFSKETKTGNEAMSVRDKIALFTAKMEQDTLPSSKQGNTLTRESSKSSKITDVALKESNVDDDDDDDEECDVEDEGSEDEEDDEEEEEEEDPVTAIEVNTNNGVENSAENIFLNYSTVDPTEHSLYRSSSSLSASSNFSKSSDDLLGHDADSSDDHHQYQRGSSLSLDRKNFYLHKYYNESRYSLDLSNSQIDKMSPSADSRLFRSSTLDSGTRTQSMYAIMESRKNNVSKLKGLVIPQINKDSQVTTTPPVVPDLPLIYSVDSIIKPIKSTSSKLETESEKEKIKSSFVEDSPAKWLQTVPPPLPKSLPPVMETSTMSLPDLPPPEFDLCADTEDQESGISSIDSPNVSIHNTPPASPKEKPHRRYHHHRQQNHRHVGSHFHSNLQSGIDESEVDVDSTSPKKYETNTYHSMWDSTDDSEASSSSDGRVLQGNNVDVINRINVLQSSKNSCGGKNDVVDAKIKLFSTATQNTQSISLKDNQRRPNEDVIIANNFVFDAKKESQSSGESDATNVMQKKNSPVSDERWSELEKKYGSKTSSHEITAVKSCEKTSNGLANSSTLSGRKREQNGSPIGFKALAETWKQRTSVENEGTLKSSFSTNFSSQKSKFNQNGNSLQSAGEEEIVESENKTCVLNSLPVSTSPSESQTVVMRERPNRSSTGSLSRPTSLIETDSKKIKLWPASSFIESDKKSPTNKLGDSNNKGTKLASPTNSFGTYYKANRSTSVNDLRQMFEGTNLSTVPHKKITNRITEVNNSRRVAKDNSNHIRMSSLDSTASESEPGTPAHYGSATSLGSSPAIDHYGSITSLASSTSLISPQELQQLIEEANQSLEESGTPSHEITVVVLQREISGGSIGITLAGGADYDSKEITVNKVLSGSLADRDGRILKGDRVLSINGRNLKGLTHREALCILKAPRSDCVLVLSRSKTSVPPDVVKDVVGNCHISRSSNKSLPARNTLNSRLNPPSAVVCTKPEIAFCSPDKPNVPVSNSNLSVITTHIVKDSSGLGFSLDGGKDSPLGDRPLTIKKIFNGSSADKNKDLSIGDEILSINGADVTKMARIEAWSMMKKLPNGTVSLVVNRKP